MTAIPADIQKAAEIAVFNFEARIQSGEFEGLDPDGTDARDALKAEIAKALAAEREACAVRAEALDRIGREWVADSLWARIKADTAAAIRTPTPGA